MVGMLEMDEELKLTPSMAEILDHDEPMLQLGTAEDVALDMDLVEIEIDDADGDAD